MSSGDSALGLAGMIAALNSFEVYIDDCARVDALRAMEEMRGALAGAQARLTVAFDLSQRAAQVAAGMRSDRVGRGVAAQVGLARRVSPNEANRYLGQVKVLTAELPECLARLRAGEVSEWRVLLVARETAWLSVGHRAVLDAEIAPRLQELGTQKIIALAQKIAYRLDPHALVGRKARAERERHVAIRPVPDAMARLSGLLPMTQAVAAYATLRKEADRLVATPGEGRTRSQLMADLLVERVTGQKTATDVGVMVNLIMTDQALAASVEDDDNGTAGDEPAHLIGAGTIPAAWARQMILDPAGETKVFLRRLYTSPTTGQLIAMESRARLFSYKMREFLILRDQICRTPWCDAPIRHADHVIPSARGGPTSIVYGRGLCEACNYANEAPGWHRHLDRDDGSVVTTTPTGHQYRSRAPAPPGSADRAGPRTTETGEPEGMTDVA